MAEWERRVQERENAKPDRYTEEERALARELKEKRRLLEQRQNSAPLGERERKREQEAGRQGDTKREKLGGEGGG